MTDARVDDPARGDWARCAPLVATQPVFPGPWGYGLTARLVLRGTTDVFISDFDLAKLGNRVVSMKAIFKLISDRSASNDGLNEVKIGRAHV